MKGEIPIPKARFDRQGRVICPVCRDTGEIPPDQWLSVGRMVCGDHVFFITADVAAAVNDILSKTRGGNWRKDLLKNVGEFPKEIQPREEGGNVLLPGPGE